MFRSAPWHIAAGLLLGVCCPVVALAQGAPPSAPVTPPPAAPVTAVAGARNYTIDAAITVVLMGAAIFAVCRSSQRV